MLELSFDLNAEQAKRDIEAALQPFVPQFGPKDPRLEPLPPQAMGNRHPYFGVRGGANGQFPQAQVMAQVPIGNAAVTGVAGVAQTPQGQPFLQGMGGKVELPVGRGGLNAIGNFARYAPGQPMRPDYFGVDYGRGNTSFGVGYQPQDRAAMFSVRHAFNRGGFAARRP